MNEVKIYLMRVDQMDLSDKRYWECVSKERRAKAQRIRTQDGQRLSLGAGILLEYAVRAWDPEYVGEVQTRENEFGKPEVVRDRELLCNGDGLEERVGSKAGNMCISLTHSGSVAGCAVADVEVGLDIEKIKGYDGRVARRFFRDEEWKFVEEKAQEDRGGAFCEQWVLKESFVKAVGMGFHLPIEEFAIHRGEKIWVEQAAVDGEFAFRLERLDQEYQMAVCTKGVAQISVIWVELMNVRDSAVL
ncbi:4'-phosphopantetheinyl transferase family protein [Diplocloster modestus]|uniref:4'-phosphopantetheinyl transferase superfamily protein n=1 Tax=Diplocloster modestus TaxID=2850322 RepID=A0ABS6K8A8_9FIRM|nr:4'-phosphopantetheinyl transferase family protein [Diplocloster modestus]MBU9726755.1 4'-phosphopantetheinyl transferase superfamily protein [Diplocloster modestus]